MIINKRLIATVGESKKYIAANVALQWVSLAANILIMGTFCRVLAGLWTGTPLSLARAAALVLVAVAVRIACGVGASRMAYLSGRAVKLRLRGLIYDKLLRLGASYRERSAPARWCRWQWKGWNSWKPISAPTCPSSFMPCWPP